MRGKIILFLFLGLLKDSQTVDDSCPKPRVQKRTIIQSELSIQNGAELLKKLTVESARNCYSACCLKEQCNVAIMHYKEEVTDEGDRLMTKHCFLFDCGSPSVCKFEYHNRYAVIEIPKSRNVQVLPSTKITTTALLTKALKTTKVEDVKTTVEPISKHPIIEHEKCAPGVPVAMCDSNPCEKRTCNLDASAYCRPSFCGGCYAKFYNVKGEEVNCEKKKENVISNNDEEIAEIQYGETPTDSLPGAEKPTIPFPTKEPYFNSERRTWPGGSDLGIIGGVKKTTSKTTTTAPEVVRNVIVEEKFVVPVPLLVALVISILLIIGLIYRFKCAKRGKPKKLPVDDGDYLINGMYL